MSLASARWIPPFVTIKFPHCDVSHEGTVALLLNHLFKREKDRVKLVFSLIKCSLSSNGPPQMDPLKGLLSS